MRKKMIVAACGVAIAVGFSACGARLVRKRHRLERDFVILVYFHVVDEHLHSLRLCANINMIVILNIIL